MRARRQTALQVVCETEAGLSLALRRLYRQGRMMIQQGRRFQVAGDVHFDDVTSRQRRFLHGVLLAQVVEQARPNGITYEMPVWKEFFRSRLLGSEWIEDVDPLTGEIVASEQRISSESLDVFGYSDFIDRVIAMATTELGVVFELDDFERASVRKRRVSTWAPLALPGPKLDCEPYRRLVAARACIHCGYEGASQAAHANSQAAGKGKGIKADDRMLFPLCADTPERAGCHPAFDQGALFGQERRRDVELQWAEETRLEIAADAATPEQIRRLIAPPQT